jgi:ribonuclease P protein component
MENIKDMTMDELKAAIHLFHINKTSLTPEGLKVATKCHKAIVRERAKRLLKNYHKREHHQAMTDLGLVRVRGSLGGVYYE